MESYSLASENPWWANKKSIYEDNAIISVDSCPVNWIPRMFYRFALDNDVINTLRGPRQVGKTTLVKLLIKKLLENDIEGRRIFYWRCDLIQGPKDLVNLLNSYIDSTRDIFDNRLYIFLDEISSVKDWQNGLKYLIDGGKLKNVLVILTGSHTIDIKKASERLPGRRGDVDMIYDKIFVPMKFSEYVELRDKDLKMVMRDLDLLNVEKRESIFFKLAKSDIPREINELNLYFNKIDRLYDEYLLTGGIIKAICSYLENGLISDVIYNTYVTSTIGDIKRWGKRESYLLQLIKLLIDRLSSPVSWNSLKKDTDVGSSSTISEYIDILKSSFVSCPIYQIDRSKGGPNIPKDKKVYFLDPFIFHALRSWTDQESAYEGSLKYLSDSINKSKLTESVVCNHFIRHLYNLYPSDLFDPSRNLFYWRRNNHEVDFIMKIKNDYIPIEVKYQNNIGGSDYKGIYSFYSADSEYKGILASKNTLDIHNEITTIPIPLLLLII